MSGRSLELPFRVAVVVLACLAVFGVASHACLLAGQQVPRWLLPLSAGIGLIVGVALRPREVAPAAPLRVSVPVLLVVLAAVAAVTYGAVATPDRDWDGFVSWSWRARLFEPPARLDHPALASPAYYVHSRGYPLLQCLCLGATTEWLGRAGRLLFPLLYVALFCLTLGVLQRYRTEDRHAWLVALAVAITPMWLNPSAGAVDSGYAELLLALCLVATAGGLLLASPALLATGVLLLPLVKPEGVPYGLAACLVAAFARTPVHVAASLAMVGGILLWVPLRDRLLFHPTGLVSWIPVGVVVGIAIGRQLVRRVGPRPVAAFASVLLVGGILAAFGYRESLAESHDALTSQLLGGISRLPERLRELPAVMLALLESVTFVRKFGLLFLVLGFLVLAPRSKVGRCASKPVASFVAIGLLLTTLSLFISPEGDLAHEVESRFDRLLLQWVGPGWLLVAAWLPRTAAGSEVGVLADGAGLRRGRSGDSPRFRS